MLDAAIETQTQTLPCMLLAHREVTDESRQEEQVDKHTQRLVASCSGSARKLQAMQAQLHLVGCAGHWLVADRQHARGRRLVRGDVPLVALAGGGVAGGGGGRWSDRERLHSRGDSGRVGCVVRRQYTSLR